MGEREIFDAALAIADPTQRSAYLEQACAGDAALRSHLDGLLAMHGELGSFLEAPVGGGAATVAATPVHEGPGTVIGPYKLLEQIGEGGFGVVFMAEQTQPVRRKVALKVLKPGMDTRQVVARFEAERQALAIMDHPNIAKVLDGGATPSGRPYFVMDLVKGVPITEFCDQNHLTPRQRLELFIPVCQAVQHAHQKGIIHRDLKPSNVLVTVHDTTPVPKVIDFGVAKALGQELTDKTLFTGFAQMIGTPLYMSPEQAGQSGLDIDTRSDIYSLGVLLYELLTGTTPFDKERFKQAAYDEIRRIIREEEPPKPSTRLSELSTPHAPREDSVTRSVTTTLASVAAQRQTEPAKLTKLVRGELDWIVMKALEKDRNRRYETANGFAADVQRYLADEPVQACPPSAWYRFRKFARRNRAALAAATAMGFAVLVAVGALAIGAFLLWQKEKEVRGAYEAESQQRRLAASNLKRALEALDQIYLRIAERLPEKPQKIDQADQELLQQVLAFYEEFARENSAEPGVREEVGSAYLRVATIRRQLRQYAEAEKALGRAITIFDGLVAETPTNPTYRSLLADGHHNLGALLAETYRPAQAEQAYRQALQLKEPLVAECPDRSDYYRFQLAKSYNNLGVILRDTGRSEEAEQAYHQALLLYEMVVVGSPNVAEYQCCLAGALHNLAQLLHGERGQLAEARRYVEQAMVHQQTALKLNPRHLTARQYLRNHYDLLGRILRRLGEQAEAEKAFERAIAAAESLVAEFPRVPGYRGALAHILLALGQLRQDTGRHEEAEESFRQAITLDRDLVAEFPTDFQDRLDLANHLNDLSLSLRQNPRRLPEGEQTLREAVRLRQELAAERPDNLKYTNELAGSLMNLGILLKDTGRPEEAQRAYDQALALARKLADQSPANPEYQSKVARILHNMALVPVSNRGQLAEVRRVVEEAILHQQEALKQHPQHPTYRESLQQHYDALGHTLHRLGEHAEAEKAYGRALAAAESLVAEFPQVPSYKSHLVSSLLSQGRVRGETGRHEEAEKTFRQAIALDPKRAMAHYNLGVTLGAQNDLPGAIAAYKQSIALDPKYTDAYFNLAYTLEKQEDLPGAIVAYQKAIALNPKIAGAHLNLGIALWREYDLPAAVAAYQDAIALDPKSVAAHSNLGAALGAQGKRDEALAAFRKAIELKPDLAEAHLNLGLTLRQSLQLAESLASIRRAHELGSRRKDWRQPSAKEVRKAERLVELDAKLPAVLSGKEQPARAGDQLAYAELCSYKRRYAASARLYLEAFTAEPARADDLDAGMAGRYAAACAAARAGSGAGLDAPSPQEQARWRRQALDWLRADLALWAKRLDKDKPLAHTALQRTLRHWQEDVDLAGLRDKDALAKLPEAEREACRQLWTQVAELLARARPAASPSKKLKPPGQ